MDIQTVREALLKAELWIDDADANTEMISLTDVFAVQNEETRPFPAQIKRYSSYLHDAYRQRRILDLARDFQAKATERFLTREEIAALEEHFQRGAFELISTDREAKDGFSHATSIMGDCIDDLSNQAVSPNIGIQSGFRDLDDMIVGFQDDEFSILCGRPGSGKTSFGIDVAINAAKQAPVAMFSLEMSKLQIAQRLLAKGACLDIQRLRKGRLSDADFTRLTDALGTFDGFDLYINDSFRLTPNQLRTQCREIGMKTGNPIKLIIVDYIQLMTPSQRFTSREREISSLSRDLKMTAKDLNCSLIVMSQLNRELEKRQNKRPSLADLRESGSLEQDCDRCIGLFQPYQYTGEEQDRHRAEAIVLKQRNGPVGTVDLYWEPTTATFHDPV